MYFPLLVGFLCLSLFCFALLFVLSSFAIILTRKRKLVALLLLSNRCLVTVNVLWLFLTVRWVGLQSVIVVFPEHTHFYVASPIARVSGCGGGGCVCVCAGGGGGGVRVVLML